MSRSYRDGAGGGAHRSYRRGAGLPRIERGDFILDTWADMTGPGGKRFAKNEASGARRRSGQIAIKRSVEEMEL